MSSMDEQILRSAKEIVVKFIETGRISPAGVSEMFKTVYATIRQSVENPVEPPEVETDNMKNKETS